MIGQKKQISILSIGHPAKVSSWSNVPYFFSKSIEETGRTVHRVDIGPNLFLRKVYDTVLSTLKKLGLKSEHDYFHGSINFFLTNRKIRRHLLKYPNTFPIFVTYTFGASSFNRPYAVFSDRTFEAFIRYFHNRPPSAFEAHCVAREDLNLKKASLVVSLFPDMARRLEEKTKRPVAYYGNVVNLPSGIALSEKDIQNKWEKQSLLFIGKKHYKEGFEILRKALHLLNEKRERPITLDVIGLDKRDVGNSNEPNITFHGYLNKADKVEYATYLRLIKEAYLFVNPNPKWASFSASCESLSLNTPLLIAPYPEFVQTFGETQSGFWYLQEYTPEYVAKRIQEISIDKENWISAAKASAKHVQEFTWPSFTQRFLEDLDKI